MLCSQCNSNSTFRAFPSCEITAIINGSTVHVIHASVSHQRLMDRPMQVFIRRRYSMAMYSSTWCHPRDQAKQWEAGNLPFPNMPAWHLSLPLWPLQVNDRLPAHPNLPGDSVSLSSSRWLSHPPLLWSHTQSLQRKTPAQGRTGSNVSRLSFKFVESLLLATILGQRGSTQFGSRCSPIHVHLAASQITLLFAGAEIEYTSLDPLFCLHSPHVRFGSRSWRGLTNWLVVFPYCFEESCRFPADLDCSGTKIWTHAQWGFSFFPGPQYNLRFAAFLYFDRLPLTCWRPSLLQSCHPLEHSLSNLAVIRNKMHRALQIPEIVAHIFSCIAPALLHTSLNVYPCHLVATDLVALARTCHTFNEPALDVLWRNLVNLSPLIRCLPVAFRRTRKRYNMPEVSPSLTSTSFIL